jgi:integrase/recombinase XerD
MSAAKSLTSTELEQVLDYIASKPNAARNRAMLLITVLAGLRVSEVAGLMLADIVDERSHIRTEVFLAAHRVKHAHARTIYISTRLQLELDLYIRSRTWRDRNLPFFATNRGQRHAFSANTLTQHFYWLYKRAGISNASSHSGRKTFLTSLSSKGISVFVLASLAGHKSITTTQRYITVNDDLKRRAVELV